PGPCACATGLRGGNPPDNQPGRGNGHSVRPGGGMMKHLWLFLILAPAAVAQQWEFGGLAGGGFLSQSTVGGTKTAVSAGFNSGPAVGISISHDLYPRLSGEIRYLFEQSNAR